MSLPWTAMSVGGAASAWLTGGAASGAPASVATPKALAHVAEAPILLAADDTVAAVWSWAQRSVVDGYDHAPALVLGLALLLAIPPLALAGLAFRRAGSARVQVGGEATRYLRRGRTAPPAELAETPTMAFARPERPRRAWVEVEEPGRQNRSRVALDGQVVRIGRDQENDIVLRDKTVHRHHAAIYRTPEGGFVVADLSGESGNGVLVNGSRAEGLALRQGDVIELGSVKLRFGASPI